MRKLSPSFFRGIKFIRTSNLPLRQYDELMNWLPPTSMIMIRVDDVVFKDCIQYKDYEYWFENFFRKEENQHYLEEF